MKTLFHHRRLLFASAALCLLAAVISLRGAGTPAASDKTVVSERPSSPTDEAHVQIAILLDTSSSMDGLIEQAKTQLWKITNEFITAKQDGKTPVVQVALYEYGKDSLSPKDYWIRQIQPLTRDLDKISEELFALKTNGGEEYCGAVIRRAVHDLEWVPSPKTYKAIFIAGNEPFTQGPIDPIKSCHEAIAKGIIVNAIHCGSEGEGIAGRWKDGALAADGQFIVINHNETVVQVSAPQDKTILALNEDLNKTYIAYGTHATEGKGNQMAQDGNAASNAASGAPVARAVSKASANYCNDRWDLVDASKKKDFSLDKVKEADLPPEMQRMTPEERKAHLDKMCATRADLQKKILTLNKERDKYVATQRKSKSKTGTLDTEVAKTIRNQAEKKGIQWEK